MENNRFSRWWYPRFEAKYSTSMWYNIYVVCNKNHSNTRRAVFPPAASMLFFLFCVWSIFLCTKAASSDTGMTVSHRVSIIWNDRDLTLASIPTCHGSLLLSNDIVRLQGNLARASDVGSSTLCGHKEVTASVNVESSVWRYSVHYTVPCIH